LAATARSAATGFDNQNVEPAKCALYCTSASTSDTLQYTTSANFKRVIYCENKPIDISANATFYGALLSRRQIRSRAGPRRLFFTTTPRYAHPV